MAKETSHVVDFNEARKDRLEEKRRKTERIFFKQILGVYAVTADPKEGLRSVEIVDVSADGLAFLTPFNARDPWPKDDEKEIVFRIYFSQDTYLPLMLKIENAAPCIHEGDKYTRVGCSIDKSVISSEAFDAFVKFMELYSIHAHKDTGKVSLFYL